MKTSIFLHDFTLALFLLGFLFSKNVRLSWCDDTGTSIGCIEKERQALLKLKQGFTEPSGFLSSWNGTDCCTWDGVGCDQTEGFVTDLRLGPSTGSSSSDQSPLGGEISPSLLQLKHLNSLDLSGNNFKGLLPPFLGNLSELQYLNLAENNFKGLLPPFLGNLSELQSLYLQGNQFNGSIPKTLGQLSNLSTLFLSRNPWEGVLTESHFSNLTSLRFLEMSSTSLSPLKFDVSPNWIPPFNLVNLDLTNYQIGPLFPSWIQFQNLTNLYLSNTGISDSIPTWFQNFTSLNRLDLSHNRIKGNLPFDFHTETSHNLSSTLFPGFERLNLRNNSFSGRIPSNIGQMMPILYSLDLSNNFIKGDIPLLMSSLRYLNLSRNLITGTIPSSICNLTGLQYLILSSNHLSGEIPPCSWNELRFLDLGSNHLTGKIPTEMGFSRSLSFLRLSNNSLYGEVPPLQELDVLITLDLGENNFSGGLQTWMGEGSSFLEVMRLRTNSFSGHIPPQICTLSHLQVIDFGDNQLSGSIPSCFGNLSALTKVGGEIRRINSGDDLVWLYLETMPVRVVKGIELDYSSNLMFLRSIDLSRNNLSGEIPSNLTELVGLNILNLSMNHMTGMIPRQIGNMNKLESLDLSQNDLLGAIPPSMSDLNFLSQLNFSNNNLSGRIPSGNQLQTLNESSIYEGNPQLCGPPLKQRCPGDEITPNSTVVDDGDEDEDHDDMRMFYISLGTGFVVGFCGVCGTLLFIIPWRRYYFQLIDDMKDTMFVFIAVRIARLRR